MDMGNQDHPRKRIVEKSLNVGSLLNRIFQTYGRYYDLIYTDKDYEKECCFIEDILARFSNSKPNKILDIACGTGEHAIVFANKGYAVTGVDSSDVMIDIAREKARKVCNGNIRFHVMDMRELKLDQRFDACICMFSGMDYLLTYEEIRKTIRGIRKHLVENSLFVFDFWNGVAVLTVLPSTRTKIVENGDKRLVRIAVPRLDAMRHLCEVTYHCLVIQKNKLVDEFEEKHVVRFFFPREIKSYLEENGFTLLRMCPFLSVEERADEKTWHLTAISQAK